MTVRTYCDCCGVVFNQTDLRWFDIYRAHANRNANRNRSDANLIDSVCICRACVIIHGGNWEDDCSEIVLSERLSESLLSERIYSESESESDSDSDVYLSTSDSDCDSDSGSDCDSDSDSESFDSIERNRIKRNLMGWKRYDFENYTKESMNDYCYKYGLKLIE